MKLVLIQTPWSNASSHEYKSVAKRFAFYPPLGLMCIAASVEQAGHFADIIDLEVENLSFDELRKRVADFEPDIIGLTASTPVFHIVRDYAVELRTHFDIPIVVGGPHISALKEHAFYPEFDFLVVQEGHNTMVELMDALEAEITDFSLINGLIWKNSDDKKIVKNPGRAFTTDLDSLPLPARHKADPKNYVFEVPGRGSIPVATIELTRGCPFKCVFCSEPLNTGSQLRKRSPRSVVDEMVIVQERFGINHFMTLDSTLTLNRKLIVDICNEIIDRKVQITWEGQTRANLIDKELLVLLKKAGLVRLGFGVESADEHVLTLMKKKVNPQDMREAFRLCGELKISTMCGTMMGNPGDTRQSILKTAWFVRSIPEVRYAPMAIAIPYPGTELALLAEQNMHGLRLLDADFTKYSRYAGGVMEVNGMMPSDLIKLQRVALFIIHSTPSKVWGLVTHFGLWNVLAVSLKQLKNQILSIVTGEEPTLRANVIHDNTTIKSL